MTAKLNYETLKIATAYLDLKWNNEQNELYEFKKNHDYTFMMEHIVSAYKRQYDSYLYLSKTACNLFGCSEVISIDEFYQLIIPEYLFDYRKTILALQEGKMKEAGVRKDFIILKANGQSVKSVEQLEEIVKQASRSTEPVLFLNGMFPSGKRTYYAVDLTQE